MLQENVQSTVADTLGHRAAHAQCFRYTWLNTVQHKIPADQTSRPIAAQFWAVDTYTTRPGGLSAT